MLKRSTSTQPFSEKTQRRIGLGLLGLGILFLAITPWRWWVEREFLHQGRVAYGSVIALHGKTSQRAEVSFVDSQGRPRIAKAEASSSLSPAYRLNQRVAVVYLPEDPSKAKLNDPVDIWATTHLFLYVGLIFGGWGSLMLRGRLDIWPFNLTRAGTKE